MTTQIKLAIIGILFISAFSWGFYNGDKHATEKYLPQIQQLKDAIDTADKEAKQKQSEYQENANEIQRQNDQRINNIRDYYKRLLQSMPSQTSPVSTSPSTETANGTPGQSTITGCPPAIEQNCALDASQVNSWREWAVKNKIPVN